LGARPRLRMAWLVLLSLGWLLAGESLAEAQQARPAGKEPSATEPVDLNRLPEPLADITGNMLDLEASGYLKLVGVQFQPAGSLYGSDNSVVWTFRTLRPITCRHLEKLLSTFVDVRFFDQTDYGTSLLYQTLLVHPDRVQVGATNGRILSAGEFVDVWIQLRDTDIRRLRGLRGNRMVAGRRPSKVE
jgi:hypothetical protein